MARISPVSYVEHSRAQPAQEPQPQSHGAVVRLLRVVSAVWISFVFVLAMVDHSFAATNPGVRPLPTMYYVTQELIAIVVLALVCWPNLNVRLGRAFLPIVIVGMSVLPLIATAITVPPAWPAPITGASGLVGLRGLPILAVVVVLIAWQYTWNQVMRFCLGITGLATVLLLVRPTNVWHALVITAMQAMSLLIVGYCACALMDKLRAQRAALEQANMQLRQYAATLEQFTISRERNRVARELHDTLAHTLSGLTVQLEATKAYCDVDPQAARGMIETALQATRSGLNETRRALKALRATPLEELGLRSALCMMAEHAAAVARLRFECVVADSLPSLPPDVEQCIYRIAQEAVINVAHHAAADTLTLQLSCNGEQVHLIVQDNGRGFDVGQNTPPRHFGIAGMVERAALAGGELVINSAPGAGTIVSFHIRARSSSNAGSDLR